MNSKAPGPAIPEHVFISFSQKDKKVAEDLVHALWREQIPVWIDYTKLAPGTPDWEAAIREAIEKAFAVVVLASPESRESKFVRGELNVAESKGRRILPLWIEGSDWSDCIPLGMTYAQYIDAREKHQEQGIAELCRVLKEHIHDVTPKHYAVSPLRRTVGKKQDTSHTQVSPPPGFVSVELTEGGDDRRQEGGAGAFFRIADYSCVQGFLDDLYVNYLRDRFKPYTYGRSWVLEEVPEDWFLRNCQLLLVPWSWLSTSSLDSDMEADWLLKRQPAECGLNAGTSWCLRKPAQVKPTGMAVNDERIYRAMRSSPKAEFFLREHGVLKDVPLDKVGADYRFRYVISAFRRFMGRPAKPGTAIVQTRKPLPEEAIKYWLERW